MDPSFKISAKPSLIVLKSFCCNCLLNFFENVFVSKLYIKTSEYEYLYFDFPTSELLLKIDIPSPISQLNLYGYEKNFNIFKELLKKNYLPNVILLNGQKGIGKATFAYHFINYLLSLNEDCNYSLSNFKINPENKSYKLILNNSHPNFFLLEKFQENENIKIHIHNAFFNTL